MNKASAIPRSVLMGLSLSLLILNGLIFVAIAFLLGLPWIAVFLVFAVALGIVGLFMLWKKPKSEVPSTLEKQLRTDNQTPIQQQTAAHFGAPTQDLKQRAAILSTFENPSLRGAEARDLKETSSQKSENPISAVVAEPKSKTAILGPGQVAPKSESESKAVAIGPTKPAPKPIANSKPNAIERPIAAPKPRANSKSATEQSAESTKCPHGKTREYCAICDPDGYVYHFGDWTTD